MEPNPNPQQTQISMANEKIAKGRRSTIQLILLLALTFIPMVVSLFTGINNNVPSAISSLLMILFFYKSAKYNPSQMESESQLYQKYYWVSYIIAGVMFVFAIKSYMRSFLMFDDMFGQALMYIAFGIYFVCYKPSQTGKWYKLLKFLGYILLGLSVLASYMCSQDRMGDSFICVAMFLIGTGFLYWGNRPYLKELFQS